ncbi:hypothetical protein K2Z84_22095 [Candidatus Binatia bacterium]|nr:hypothetical protein [Candidatus Binatia bacterium]
MLPFVAAAVAYALAVIALSWPLARQATTALVDPLKLPNAAGVWGRADLDLLVWILAWTAHALATDPTQLFQANIFHPARDTLASSENLLGLAPLATPLFLLTHNPVLTYDVTVLAVIWLAAICTFALVRAWSGSAGAAFLAGAAFALGPQLTGGFVRLHVSAVHFFPLVMLFSWRAASRPRPLTLAALALVTALQMLAGIYVAFELIVLLAAFAPALCWEARRNGRSVLPLVLALALGSAALAIVAPAYLRVRAAGTLPALPEAIADVATTSPAPRLLWSWLVAELTLPGLVLAGFGLLAGTGPLHLRLGLLLIACAGLVLGAGTALPILPGGALPSVYEILMWAVPGFAGMRSPARFLVLSLLSTAVLGGLGAGRVIGLLGLVLGHRGRQLGTAVASGAAVALVVLRAPPLPLPLVPVPLGGVAYATHAWLAQQPERGPVIDVPVMNSSMDGTAVLATGRAMIGSTLHFLPLLNGYTGHPPAASSLLLTLAQRLPDESAFATMCGLAAPRWIVVHEGLLPTTEVEQWHVAERTLGIARVAQFGRDAIYRVDAACARTQLEMALGGSSRPGTTFAGAPLTPLEPGTFDGRIDAAIPRRLAAGSFTWLWVDVHNDGGVVLPGLIGLTPGGVQLQARWWDARTGRLVAFGEATPLGTDLAPGASVRAQVGLAAPKTPGDFVVEIGLAQQGGGWLGDVAGGTPFLARGRVRIEPAGAT